MKGLAGSILVAVLFMAVQVAAVSIVNEPYTAEVGIYHNWTNGIYAQDMGIGTKTAGAAIGSGACSNSVLLAQSGNLSRTDITSGDLVQSVNVTLLDGSMTGNCFRVTVTFNGLVLTQLYLNSTSTPAVGDYAVCQFDLGTAVPSGAYSIQVDVQRIS